MCAHTRGVPVIMLTPLPSTPQKVVALLLASKTGLGRLMQEDAGSAAERRKLGGAMAGLSEAMNSIASAVGKSLDPEEAATADDLQAQHRLRRGVYFS